MGDRLDQNRPAGRGDEGSGPPLAGVRVLAFTHAVMGPAAGLILADLGAEVTNIEPPGGDPTRRLKGFGLGYYAYLNRNKRSLALDIKTEAGRAVVMRLVKQADVVIENFAPGTMDRLGCGYDDLAAVNPKLIYCSLKGFMPGPFEHRTAMDEVVQMMGGLAYMTGPPGRPMRAGTSVIDLTGGMFGVIAILAALRQRQADGRGRLVKSALFETTAFLMGQHMACAARSEEPVPPMSDRVSAWSVYRLFETADGQQLFIGIISDAQWRRFCREFHRPDWLADEGLATNSGRIDQRETLLPGVDELIAGLDLAEAVEKCEAAGVSFAPVARPEDLFTSPQLTGEAGLLETEFPTGERAGLPRLPISLAGTDLGLRRQPPARPGVDSREILLRDGLDQGEIGELITAGVVVVPDETAD